MAQTSLRGRFRRVITTPLLSNTDATTTTTRGTGVKPDRPGRREDESEPSAVDPSEPAPAAVQDESTTKTVEKATAVPRGFPRYLLVGAILFWTVASVAGAVSAALPTLPQEASISLDGEPVGRCFEVAPGLATETPAIGTHWCTSTEYVGAGLPDEVVFTQTGRILWDVVDADDVLKAATQPDVWFTLAMGAIAMLFLVAFARATNTVRAGLAASISVVFFGLLLFPLNFTARIPADMRSELVNAWQLVLVFYFGTEGTIQALKVLRPGSDMQVGGDLSGEVRTTTTTLNS